jgi:16S rRNA C1402 (ribose-2'-O) methylase RsmI
MKNNEVPAIPFPASAVLWLHVSEQSEILLHRELEKITEEIYEHSLSSASERAFERKVSGSIAKRWALIIDFIKQY